MHIKEISKVIRKILIKDYMSGAKERKSNLCTEVE